MNKVLNERFGIGFGSKSGVRVTVHYPISMDETEAVSEAIQRLQNHNANTIQQLADEMMQRLHTEAQATPKNDASAPQSHGEDQSTGKQVTEEHINGQN